MSTGMRDIAKTVYHSLPFKRQVLEFVRNRVDVPPQISTLLNFEGPFHVRIDDDHGFSLHSTGAGTVENNLFWRGFGTGWEARTLSLWIGLARTARVIVDIGANTGVFALSAKSLNPEAKIIAFEPAPRIFKLLESNVALNHYDIEVAPVGLSNQNGSSTFFDAPAVHSYSGSFNPVVMEGRADTTQEEIQIVRFDDFLAERQLSGVDLIKVDVEMHEGEVLEGAAACIERDRPTIVIELLTRELAGEVNAMFRHLDYVFFQIDEAKGLVPLETLTDGFFFYKIDEAQRLMPLEQLADGRFGGEMRDWNFLLCPRDKVDSIASMMANPTS